MIPVAYQPEPDIFDELVRTPGKQFIKKLSNSKPKSRQWEKHNHWKHISPHLYKAYDGICAYSAHWIPRGDNPNVDHFIPKSVKPELAYEWSNYRLASPLINTLKRDFQDVLDPFTIGNNWFFLDFPSLLIRPNYDLPNQVQEQIWATIERLKLNESMFVDDRSHWLEPYCRGREDFSVLKRDAPFIAHEIERQELVEDIKTIMAYGPETEE